MSEISFAGRPSLSAAWRKALRPAARAWLTVAAERVRRSWSMYAANPSTVTAWPLSRKASEGGAVGHRGEFAPAFDLQEGGSQVGTSGGRCGHLGA